jgi:hypothetical protein
VGGWGVCKVIGKSKRGVVGDRVKVRKKDIIADSKDERGERATLFDTPEDPDRVSGIATAWRLNLDTAHEAPNEVAKPRGETDLLEDGENKSVVDRVEGFSSV